ncbi:MAG: alpha/beta fold hydrolase [Deltaproteobacteria bacterium]|nr:alpha/beta fold hydrolase [Deltaproteobacteria bacterium]
MLLHGLAATGPLNWFTAFSDLAERYHVVAVDHRGHGRGIPTRRFRLKDCADDVVAVADALGIRKFIAVGYSMGGPIAKLCWSRHPERVRGLVLCATARHFTPERYPVLTRAILPGAVIGARVAPKLVLGQLRPRCARAGNARRPSFLVAQLGFEHRRTDGSRRNNTRQDRTHPPSIRASGCNPRRQAVRSRRRSFRLRKPPIRFRPRAGRRLRPRQRRRLTRRGRNHTSPSFLVGRSGTSPT